MKIRMFPAACCLSIFFLSCNTVNTKVSKNDKRNDYTESVQLKQIGEKIFPLDSLTSQSAESISYCEPAGDSVAYMSFLNTMAHRIYFYNYKQSKLAFFTPYQKEGPMGVGKVSGHSVANLDSIFLWDGWTSRLSIIDKKGDKVGSFSLSYPGNQAASNLFLPVPRLSCANPLFIYNGLLLLTGNDYGEFDQENSINRPVLTIYNIADRVVNYAVPYPEVYQQANWGAQNYRDIFSTFNEAKGTILISFPADHYLYEYNVKTKAISKYYAGSSHFGDIPSLDKKKSFMDKDFFYRYFGINPSYSSIVYDKYRNVYYRFADLPISDYDPDVREKSIKQFSIIILNNKLEKIGETVLPLLSHSRLSFFISPEGLLLKKYTKDEDHLTFSLFVPQPVS
jgi:hypothetical protein